MLAEKDGTDGSCGGDDTGSSALGQPHFFCLPPPPSLAVSLFGGYGAFVSIQDATGPSCSFLLRHPPFCPRLGDCCCLLRSPNSTDRTRNMPTSSGRPTTREGTRLRKGGRHAGGKGRCRRPVQRRRRWLLRYGTSTPHSLCAVRVTRRQPSLERLKSNDATVSIKRT